MAGIFQFFGIYIAVVMWNLHAIVYITPIEVCTRLGQEVAYD